MKAKPTAGPWRVLPLKGKHYGTLVELSNGTTITVWGTGGDGFHTLSCDPEDGAYPSERELAGWEGTPGDADWRDRFCDTHWESAGDLANARLIAAAPDLLDALRALRGWATLAYRIDPGIAESIDGDPCWTAARAVLAKLEGATDGA